MNISLDYDGTITANRSLWLAFYYLCKTVGVNVYVITMRHEHEPITDWPGIVYYTCREAKIKFCRRNNIQIDIWIDDRPDFIFNDSV